MQGRSDRHTAKSPPERDVVRVEHVLASGRLSHPPVSYHISIEPKILPHLFPWACAQAPHPSLPKSSFCSQGAPSPEACSTDLPPLPEPVVFLEESLVMGHAVFAVDEAIENVAALAKNGGE